MAQPRVRVLRLLVLVTALTAASCASVPKEVVELSYRMGEDLQSIRASYDALVHAHFDDLRRQRRAYVDDEWAPTFVRNFMAEGRLPEIAKGIVVWSTVKEDFENVTAGTPSGAMLESITLWAAEAVYQIENKKASLLQPLDAQELELRAAIRDAFDQLATGNATVTAHLNSLRKVQEVQDQALAALQVKDLRDRINNMLIATSEQADQAMDKVRAADKLVKQGADMRSKAEELIKKLTGTAATGTGK